MREVTHQRMKGRRRFYREVSVREAPSEPGIWQILLDKHVLRTPARRPLHFDTPELAVAVAAEWDAQTSAAGIEPSTMPLMTLSATTIDQTAEDPAFVVDNCMRYLATDTICFLAADEERILLERQRARWGPLHDWLRQDVGLPLATSQGKGLLQRPEHPAAAAERCREVLEAMDPWALTAVQSVTMECKSVGIALALALRQIDVDEAFEAARIEEEFNIEVWGLVEGGHDLDQSFARVQLTAASTLFWLRGGVRGLPEGLVAAGDVGVLRWKGAVPS
ncbi:unnamed protein product [Phaeothamnion confervicola]